VAINPLSWIDFVRRLDRLFEVDRKHGALIEAQAAEISALKDRLTRLEEQIRAREEILIVEAKAAAGIAASSVAAQHVSDISGRLGRVEERVRSLTADSGLNPRLPSS
jgi:hypothetical protein